MRRRRGGVRTLKVLPVIMMVTVGYLVYWWVQSRDATVDATIIQTPAGDKDTKPEAAEPVAAEEPQVDQPPAADDPSKTDTEEVLA